MTKREETRPSSEGECEKQNKIVINKFPIDLQSGDKVAKNRIRG